MSTSSSGKLQWLGFASPCRKQQLQALAFQRAIIFHYLHVTFEPLSSIIFMSRTIIFMSHLCQFWFSKLLIEWYLVDWVFLEQGGTWWQYGSHKWYVMRKSLGTTGLGKLAHWRTIWSIAKAHCQVSPLWVRAHLGIIIAKEYSSFPKTAKFWRAFSSFAA